jgi:flagellar biosynthesis/type III secretory pathway protein FliH
MNAHEYEERLKALQQEVTRAYLAGYTEARERSQHTIKFAIDESDRLRRALEEALAHVDETARVRILATMLRGKPQDPESSQEPYRQNRDE